MAAEPAILSGGHRMFNVERQFVEAHLIAFKRTTPGQHFAIGGEHHDAALFLRQVVQVGFSDGQYDVGAGPGTQNTNPQEQHQKPVNGGAQERPPGAGRLRCATL